MSEYKQGKKRDDVRCFECCECCHKEPHKPEPKPEPKPCPDHHKPDHDKCPKACKKESAQFTSDEKQEIRKTKKTAIKFNRVPVRDGCDIQLETSTSIFLAPGRYLVSYYLTVDNDDNDDDTLVARLKLNNDILDYTIGRVSIDNENDDDHNKPLSKTNLIDVHRPSELQLIVSAPFDNDVDFDIRDASIVILEV